MRQSRIIFLCFLLIFQSAALLYAQSGRPRRYPIADDPKIWRMPTKGESVKMNSLVLLGAFKDVSFSYSKEQIKEVLVSSQESAQAYLREQLGYDINITVAGPFFADKNRSYYGENDATSSDVHAGEFIAAICKEADAEVDFSQFDFNGDGAVDNVYVIFAGGDESDLGTLHPEYIWAHSWTLKESSYKKYLTLDSVTVNRYACSAELRSRLSTSGKITETLCSIGTFCHEFMHPLGLVDLYDTDYDESGGCCPGAWASTSLMDSGSYNNDEKTPPFLNSIERQMLGTMVPEELEIGKYTITPIGKEGAQSFKITNPSDEEEYYLLECRANDGWDKYIGGKGLLLYHIDKSASRTTESDRYGTITSAKRWYPYNEVNCRPDHPCADLVEADGRTDRDPATISFNDITGIFFPQPGAYSIGGTANIKLPFWDGSYSKILIKNISLAQDGSVSFEVQTADSPLPPTPTEPPAETDMVYIIVQTADEVCSLSVSNSVGATVKWYFNGSPIADPDNFTASSSGEIHAVITWEDGSEDDLFKTIKK